MSFSGLLPSELLELRRLRTLFGGQFSQPGAAGLPGPPGSGGLPGPTGPAGIPLNAFAYKYSTSTFEPSSGYFSTFVPPLNSSTTFRMSLEDSSGTLQTDYLQTVTIGSTIILSPSSSSVRFYYTILSRSFTQISVTYTVTPLTNIYYSPSANEVFYISLQGSGGGSTGPAGALGPTGYTGVQGVQGSAVNTGATGPVGHTGVQGPTGYTGPTGIPGSASNTGATGPAGPAFEPAPLPSQTWYLNSPIAATTSVATPIIFSRPDANNYTFNDVIYSNVDGTLTNVTNDTVVVLVSGQVVTDNTSFDVNYRQPETFVVQDSSINILTSSVISFQGSSFTTTVILPPGRNIQLQFKHYFPPPGDTINILSGITNTRVTFTQLSNVRGPTGMTGPNPFPLSIGNSGPYHSINYSLVPSRSNITLGSLERPFQDLYVSTNSMVFVGASGPSGQTTTTLSINPLTNNILVSTKTTGTGGAGTTGPSFEPMPLKMGPSGLYYEVNYPLIPGNSSVLLGSKDKPFLDLNISTNSLNFVGADTDAGGGSTTTMSINPVTNNIQITVSAPPSDTGPTGATTVVQQFDITSTTTGPTGSIGIDGPQGSIGPTGYTGAQGVAGFASSTGAQGVQGAQGDLGVQGVTGAQGIEGYAASTGAQGAQGNLGVQGFTGAQGLEGYAASTGAQGAQGNLGVQGFTGAQGLEGYAASTLSLIHI